MARNEIVNPTLDDDNVHISNLANGQTFMAAVSPWFFTVRVSSSPISLISNTMLK